MPEGPRWYVRDLVILTGLALLARVLAAALIGWAPYTDPSYYTLVATRLAEGHGFTVPVLWSFLEVGGRLPVWRSTVELPTAGDLQTTGTLRLGPLWIATRPAWPGFLLTTALTTAMLMALRAVTAALWRLARSWRTPPGFCRACRYDLDGLPPGPCPECGRRT